MVNTRATDYTEMVTLGSVSRRHCSTGRFLSISITERFWRHVYKTTGCWFWTGAKGSNGYGYIEHEGRLTGAHRVSYELHSGKIQPGLQIRHDCDTPLCVNPSHMRLGTARDNAQDKIARGRMPDMEPPHYFGERHPNCKLSSTDIAEIKRLRGEGWSYMQLAGRHFVTKQQIANIVKGRQRVAG
jgi:hypothetical protein